MTEDQSILEENHSTVSYRKADNLSKTKVMKTSKAFKNYIYKKLKNGNKPGLIFLLFLFLGASFNLDAQTSTSVNGDPTFNLSISNLPSLACGTSMVSFCNRSDNQCYISTGATDNIKPNGYEGVYVMDISGPDSIYITQTNTGAVVLVRVI